VQEVWEHASYYAEMEVTFPEVMPCQGLMVDVQNAVAEIASSNLEIFACLKTGRGQADENACRLDSRA
jgi:hypothetical protein